MDVLLTGEAYSLAGSAGAGRSAYPVHIVLRVLGEVVVYYMRHALYMHLPGGTP